MDELEYIKKIERDVDEVKKDVKALMVFMAIEQAKNKRDTILFSGFISLTVSAVALAIGKLL